MSQISISGFGGWFRAGVLSLTILMGGAAGGYWYSATYAAGNASSSTHTDEQDSGNPAAADTWYTCGMHPQVLQREPGICPICNMKLTPLKQESSDSSDSNATPMQRHVLYWRSPMHPDFTAQAPGKDFMGHDLVPVYSDEMESAGGKAIHIDPVTIQNMGIRTTRVHRGPLVKTVRTVGRIDYDEKRLVFVDTKFAGWIEKLHVNETGQRVRSGDPLFEVYSPELYSAQVEYISAVRNQPALARSTFSDAADDAQRMVEAARMKLHYLDVPTDQIEALAKTLKPEKTLGIRAPADGIIADKMALEGMHIQPGMRLFTIADLSRVWVYVDIYEYQLPWVHVGQIATMTLPYIPDKAFRGEVTYIYPYLQKQTRVIKVRLEFENPYQDLKPDMYANVLLEGLLKNDAVLVPREGFIDSGTRKVAFVDRGNGKFEPRDIRIGVESETGAVEVLSGLDEGDVVVTSGQFLLDSESKLKEAIAKMMEPTRATPRTETQDHAEHAVAKTIPSDAVFACPMRTHPNETDSERRGSYYSATAGDCPWCGMRLEPLTDLPWAVAMRAADGAAVGYTCVDHPQVYADGPGECPVCHAPLQPFKTEYACGNPRHSEQSSHHPADCPRCREPMAITRGPWLDEALASRDTSHGDATADHAAPAAATQPESTIPTNARYVCPMQACHYFSATEGRCDVCGMKIKPIEEVAWAAALRAPAGSQPRFVCPMHPKRATSDEPGICPICAMQLLPRDHIVGLDGGVTSTSQQADYLTEHYLALAQLLAQDTTVQTARHALGLVDAAEKLRTFLTENAPPTDTALLDSVNTLHAGALQLRGEDLAEDRVQFARISAAMRVIISNLRPDRKRWPTLYIYHCPMSKADWIQSDPRKANPYYGFKMLDCGDLVDQK